MYSELISQQNIENHNDFRFQITTLFGKFRFFLPKMVMIFSHSKMKTLKSRLLTIFTNVIPLEHSGIKLDKHSVTHINK